MRFSWLLFILGVFMLGGCSHKKEEPLQSHIAPKYAPNDGTTSCAMGEAVNDCDTFYLPLIIVLNVPETPPGIAEPSPPIPKEAPTP